MGGRTRPALSGLLPGARRYDGAVTWDAIVVGAGPAGSLAAYRLAQAGARVLLLDRASFPRDKPCGGGLTLRAVKQLPFGVDPVVEHVVDRMAFRLGYGPWYERQAAEPLILMTQRRLLDAFLAEQAASAGAEFRDGERVTAVAEDEDGVTVTVAGRTERCRLLLGADGANGITARQLGLCAEPTYGVALEGNLPYGDADPSRYRRQGRRRARRRARRIRLGVPEGRPPQSRHRRLGGRRPGAPRPPDGAAARPTGSTQRSSRTCEAIASR